MPALDNAKRERFCLEYLKDLNGKQAAIRTGYSKKTAESQASFLLSIPKVAERVAELKGAQFKRLQMGADEVLLELSRIARSDLRKVFDENGDLKRMQDLDDETAAAIASVEVSERKSTGKTAGEAGVNEVEMTKKIRAWDKTKALDLLAKHHGLFERDNAQLGKALNNTFKSDRDFARRVAFFLSKGMREKP